MKIRLVGYELFQVEGQLIVFPPPPQLYKLPKNEILSFT